MKTKAIAATILALLGAAVTGPAYAEQSEFSVLLFGRDYNDGVTAIPISRGQGEDDRHPSYFLFPAQMRIAQQVVMDDPLLMDALERRRIAVHNVLWVQTAANGGRVIYYR